MILSCNHISKSYGTDIILDDCSFFINENEKAAIVGNNGAGKSTIMKIIMSELSADNGNVIISKDKTIGYLAQYQDLSSHNSIYEEIRSVKQNLMDMEQKLINYEKQMSHLTGDELTKLMDMYTNLEHKFQLLNGYSYKSEIEGVIKGLGFTEDDFTKQVGTLSGGQKTRVALCKLLLEKPDIIMLDEPTNHLDLNSIKWLETYLVNYSGAVLIIAHDRYFLDKIVTKVIEVENHKCMIYSGNYSDFAKKKRQIRQARMNLYLKQKSEIKHQEEVIAKLRSYKQEKFYKRAESREKALSKIDLIDKPLDMNDGMIIALEPDIISGNDVLAIDNLSKSYNTALFSNLSFEIKRGEHVALIGDNGTGKTTILKIINNLTDADGGIVTLGTNVHIGYYDQEHHNLSDENTLFEEISNAYPNMNNTKIRNTLAAFMFTDDDVFKKVSELSGGEKGRLSLAKLMLSEANLIILDEPTNHLDMVSKEILENAINNYTGTVLYVSHDRYFINQTATRILELKNTKLLNYLGNYDYYEEKCEQMTATFAPKVTEEKQDEKNVSSNKQEYLERKAKASRVRKLKNDINKVEEKIKKYEDRLNELDDMTTDPTIATNSAKLNDISKEQNEISDKLDELMEEWEVLSSQL